VSERVEHNLVFVFFGEHHISTVGFDTERSTCGADFVPTMNTFGIIQKTDGSQGAHAIQDSYAAHPGCRFENLAK
jgi:hypothetical protein